MSYEAVENTQSDADRYFQALAGKENGERVCIPSEDPIGLYNHTIKQFNAKCNKVNESVYEPLPTNCFYSIWMVRWWTRLRADENFLYLLFSLVLSFLISLVPIVNLAHFAIWVLVYLIYEVTFRSFKKNRGLCDDPFKWMILAPEVCRRCNLLNVYFEIQNSEIESFGFRESQKSMLRSRSAAGRISFMVYNERFKAAYTKFPALRVYHIVQILLVLGGILFANFLLYKALGINEFLT